MTLSLILAYAAALALLACALLWSRWPRWLKGLLVLGVTLLYFHGHQVVHAVWGVPSSDALPPRFLLLAGVVEEPGPRNPGAVFLWVSELREGRTSLEPRGYKVPYSKELHSQIEQGLKRGRDGVAQMGTAELKLDKPGAGILGLRPGNDEQELLIKDLPVPQLPEK
jgi:hypothetical protein